MSNELLPCPFCGSHDVEVQGKPAILDSLDSVLCNECTADAPYPVWNTRAKSTPAEHVQEPVAYGRWAEGLPKGTRLLRYDGMPQVDYKPSETFNVPLYAAPKAEQPPVQDITYWSIQVEKRLCEKLGKPWQASGMSIETLIDELAAAAPAQPQSEAKAAVPDMFWAEKLAIKFCEQRSIDDKSTNRAIVVDAFTSGLRFSNNQPQSDAVIELLRQVADPHKWAISMCDTAADLLTLLGGDQPAQPGSAKVGDFKSGD